MQTKDPTNKPLNKREDTKKRKGKGKGRPSATHQSNKQIHLATNFYVPVLDEEVGQVVLYNVHAILANQEKATVSGDLRQDLPEGPKGWFVSDKLDPQKVARWVEAGRLVAREVHQKRSGAAPIKTTYAEPDRWMGIFGEEEQTWINACVDLHNIQKAEGNAKRTLAAIFGQIAEVAVAAQAEQEKQVAQAEKRETKERRRQKAKTRLGRKERREMEDVVVQIGGKR
jgi:hypothetical protein